MINQNSKTKIFFVTMLVVIISLFAIPNIYKDDYAVQLINKSQPYSAEELQAKVALLTQVGIQPKSSTILKDRSIEIRFADSEQQLQAKTVLDKKKQQAESIALKFAKTTPEWLRKIGADPVNLGLDLRGGIRFLMKVETDAIINKIHKEETRKVKIKLRKNNIRYKEVRFKNQSLLIKFHDADSLNAAESLLKQNPNKSVKIIEDTLQVAFNPTYINSINDSIINQNIDTIQKRINNLGVSETTVQRQGKSNIAIELPGVQNPNEAKNILKTTATLEFKLVDSRKTINNTAYSYKNSEFFLNDKIILTGESIIDAKPDFDQMYNQPQVSINLDSRGGKKMHAATKDNIGRKMAVVLTKYQEDPSKVNSDKSSKSTQDSMIKIDKVISVATIQSQLGDRFVINGLEYEEAIELAISLKSGALKAPIKIIEEKIIGPTIGKRNIEKGAQAILAGLFSVILFMAFYYRVFGLIAGVNVLINITLIMGIISLIQGATLTLPGIAGIVLTIGMAVDGNILVFERIKEEIKNKKEVQEAIYNGYKNAISTITDANLTTLITSAILFAVGTGTVKGFALTMMIGIITSMFTVIIVSRIFVNAIYGKANKKISIGI